MISAYIRFYIHKNHSCSACVNAAVIETILDAVRYLQFNFDPRNTAKCARDSSVRRPSQSLRRSCCCCACATRHDTTGGVQSGNAGTTYSQWNRVVAVALSPAAPARWQSTSACYLINCKSTLGARVHVQRMVWCFLRIYSLTTAVSLKTDSGGAVLCPGRWRGTSACR